MNKAKAAVARKGRSQADTGSIAGVRRILATLRSDKLF